MTNCLHRIAALGARLIACISQLHSGGNYVNFQDIEGRGGEEKGITTQQIKAAIQPTVLFCAEKYEKEIDLSLNEEKRRGELSLSLSVSLTCTFQCRSVPDCTVVVVPLRVANLPVFLALKAKCGWINN